MALRLSAFIAFFFSRLGITVNVTDALPPRVILGDTVPIVWANYIKSDKTILSLILDSTSVLSFFGE
jgi:hypothetical protein